MALQKMTLPVMPITPRRPQRSAGTTKDDYTTTRIQRFLANRRLRHQARLLLRLYGQEVMQ